MFSRRWRISRFHALAEYAVVVVLVVLVLVVEDVVMVVVVVVVVLVVVEVADFTFSRRWRIYRFRAS